MTKLAICSVVFEPTFQEYKNLKNIENSGFETYFFLNGKVKYKFKKACLLKSDTNLGLSVAMNLLYKKVFDNDIDIIVFLDQDTKLNFKTLTKNKSIICKKIRNNGLGTLMQYENKTINIFINSGLILSKKAYFDIGEFNTKFFVDNIDYDYSLRSHMLGYSIIGCKDYVDIDHYLLQKSSFINLSFLRIAYRNYGTRYDEIFSGIRYLILKSLRHNEMWFFYKFCVIYLKEFIKKQILKLGFKNEKF